MRVKLLISRAGVGFVQKVGDEIDVADAEGARLIAAGKAVPVRQERKETATKKPAAEKVRK